MTSIILIPARLASTRLANKPLARIGDKPMIIHAWEQACAANMARVVVAAGDAEIVAVVEEAGGEAVLTPPELPSGSDRIYHALQQIDPQGEYQSIINMQGDLPLLPPIALHKVQAALADETHKTTHATIQGTPDMASLAAPITEPQERDDPNCVKAIIAWDEAGDALGRALYFTRATAPYGAGTLYHHIGIYAYQREALARFVSYPPSPLERQERLEQLRALEHGMVIRMARLDKAPFGVDTAEDLEKMRQLIGKA